MPLKEIILESKERSRAPDIFKLDHLELLTESTEHGKFDCSARLDLRNGSITIVEVFFSD